MRSAPMLPRVLQDIVLAYLPDKDEVPYFSLFRPGVVQIYNGDGRNGDNFHDRKKWKRMVDAPKVEIRMLL